MTNHHRWRGVVPVFAILFVAVSAAAQTHPANKSASSDRFSDLATRADKASNENRLDDAKALYTKALAIRPRWEEGWWSLGTLEYDQDHYAKAANAFGKLLALNPRNGSAHALLGLCQFELHQDEAALRHLLAAEKFGIVKDEQTRKVAVFHLGLLQLRAQKFGAATETLQDLAKDRLETRELFVALGQAALLIRPQDSPPENEPGAQIVEQVGQAESLFAQKRFDEARKILAGLVMEYPDYPNLHVAYGRFLLETQEIDGAVAEFQAEIKNNPMNVPARLQIAAARYRIDSADGVKYAKEAIQLDGKQPLAHYLLGLLYLDIQKYSDAISELEIAKSNGFQKVPEVYFALASAYSRAGKNADAIRARAVFTKLKAESNGDNGDLKSSGLGNK